MADVGGDVREKELYKFLKHYTDTVENISKYIEEIKKKQKLLASYKKTRSTINLINFRDELKDESDCP